ncbi:hypothetical protein JZ785_02710 [Alicyclobacillus curvatus]|nr:hypothetical protein JZ785_02710 [Alicyclobacillus curvatus]
MPGTRAKAPLYGWISVILSVVVWLFVFKYLFYWMDIRSVIRFSTFEAISLPLTLLHVLIGIFGLVRRERMLVLSIVGVVVASLSFIWLIVMMGLNGM